MARYIDADRLKRQMEFVCMGIMSGTDPYNAPLNEIDEAPTADVRENVHAHWEKAYGDSRLMCSVCKSREIVPTMMGKPIVWGFCPNCGAVIDERSEDD